MPTQDSARDGVRTSTPTASIPERSGIYPPGVPDDWFGPLDSYCAKLGLSEDVRRAFEKSLASDAEFLNLTQRQQFLSALTGKRHLAKLAEDKRNGVALSRRKARRKGR